MNIIFRSALIQQFKNLNYATNTMTVLPQILCLIGVTIWYLYKLIKEIVRLCRADSDWREAILQQPESENQINYVKQLLERNPVKIKKYFFSGLQLPLPVLIAIFVATLILFQEQSDVPNKPINWPALTLASSVRYAGYQVAVIFTEQLFIAKSFFHLVKARFSAVLIEVACC
uniref:Uncharacterized protein n=1 Tax=Amphimedon queenslandica TaxID=400682 RepID=A0A1X7US89_AMPQE